MSKGAHESPRMAFLATGGMLGLAFLFPIGLMVFNPTLMFERGWEQFVGSGLYFWAVLTLGRELLRLWRDEKAFLEAPALLDSIRRTFARPWTASASGADESNPAAPGLAGERRILPARVRQLVGYVKETHTPSAAQLMEVNRESSGLDQEHAAGRFTLTRYILYLLPVIGFIGTVEGISKALMEISGVLPLVKDLDAFLGNLTKVTLALQVAFDSTLLALFLSAALMLVQTMVFRRAEEMLARVDLWVVEHVLPEVGHRDSATGQVADAIDRNLARLREDLAALIAPAADTLRAEAGRIGETLAGPVDRLGSTVEQLGPAMAAFQRGVQMIGRMGDELETLGEAADAARHGAAALNRIEKSLAQSAGPNDQLDEIRRGLDRATSAVENLAGSWASAYEKSSRSTQEQLARTLNSLKDALELINVSMEQGNSLYRNIVKKMFDERAAGAGRSDTHRAA